ncbi:Ceramide phosphoethanolamine synthase [Halotydeus destructor]|nr:Ceramide phosphoethanolamine synthase [Halotydeus destructor]
MATRLAEHRVTVIGLILLIFFFLWMDITLYYKIQNLQPVFPSSTGTPNAASESPDVGHLFSPFKGLSVKLMMMDQVNNYIFTPMAEVFDEMTEFSRTFTSITPNMISFIGVICAFIAARLMMCDNIIMHKLAVVVFQFRTFFDALDGIVARNHLGIKQHISLRKTSGYAVDAICDTIGFLAFLIGCYVYLKRNLPKQRHTHQYLPLQVIDADDTKSNHGHKFVISQYIPPKIVWTSKQVFFVCFCFAGQLSVSAFFWNRYIEEYHQLLETGADTRKHAIMQNEVLHSSIMWVLMWFWRISNAHSLMQMLLVAVFVNRLWDFLTWIQYIGFVELFVFGFFTEMHLNDVEAYLSHSSG